MRKIIGVVMVLASLAGALMGGAEPAGAAVVVHNEGWYLAGTRACLYSSDFHDNGWVQLQVWCYNDNDTALVGNLNVWFPDFAHPVIQAGNGAGVPAKVKIIADHNLGNPATNFTPKPGTIRDIDHTGSGWQIWYDLVSGSDFGAGSAWWGGATTPVEVSNTDAQLTFNQN